MTEEDVARCVELPIAFGETLIRHVDYEDFGSPHEGTRRIAGRIRSLSAVESPLRVEPSGSVIWYVTINVDGELVTLSKSAAESDGPDGPGMWAACDDFAQRVTGFSQNPNLWSGMNDWARLSRRCALL